MEENIGRKIRLLREQAGLTQEDVAEAMEVSRQAVSKWEANLSRPSSENLIRLARLFKVDLTDIIGAPEEEESAAKGEAPEGPKKRRRWPWILGITLLALAALFGSPLTALLFMVNTQSDGPAESLQVTVEEAELPESLALTASAYYGFAPYPNYGSPADRDIVEEGLLFQYRFATTNMTIVFYRERSACQDGQGREELYHLYAAYTNGDGAYTMIARIAEDRPDYGAPSLSAFEALGYRGCKVETEDDWGKNTFLFGLDGEGIPRLLYMIPGETVEGDIDGDGEEELLFPDHPEGILFLDREVEDYTAYAPGEDFPAKGELTAQEDGFHLRVPGEGGRIFRYFQNGTLRQNCREEFSTDGIDPAVADTVITFLYPDWSDGLDPNGTYGDWDSHLPTHREFAYLALQTLYDLTGQRVERCYAAATKYGVTFSLDRNLDHHSFFGFGRTAEWSGNDLLVGGIEYIAWKSEHTPWSPILPVEAGDAQWVYDHVPMLQSGPIVETSPGLGADVRLHLAGGSFYEVSFDGPGGLPTRIQGLYPAGFEH